jgi:TonB-linked SusC/RagA family outer membrane protein
MKKKQTEVFSVILVQLKHKLHLLMRTTIFIMLLTGLQAFSLSSEAQSEPLSIKVENSSLRDVFRMIEDQSDYHFMYNSRIVNVDRSVSIGVDNMEVPEILDVLFLDTDIVYQIEDRQIALTSRENSKQLSRRERISKEVIAEELAPQIQVAPNSQQQNVVTGRITGDDGIPLIGVNIVIADTEVGTISDGDGRYTIEVPDNNVVLRFTYVGYLTQEILVGNRREINVILESDIQAMEEVVVVGYGTQKKSNLTGAVGVISSENIENRQAATVSQILQGLAPGLDFSIGNFGFQPGATMGIKIRGMGSINGGSPYILIDGFPGDMNRLNPEDIESISILKDAAASAIYGARAPYGVILITTKSGKKKEKISVTYSGNVTVNTAQRLPETLDSYTFARVLNEATSNSGGFPAYNNAAIDRIVAYQNEDWEYLKQFMPEDVTHFETPPLGKTGMWGYNISSHANYDWFDEYYGHSVNQKQNLSIRGGSDKTSYYFSGGYLGQDGVLNYGTDTYKRVNISAKINTSITDWWDVRYETRMMKSNREMPNMTNWSSYDQIFHYIASAFPTDAKYDGYGNYAGHSGIPLVTEAGTDNIELTENWHILATEMRPAKGWKINGDFAYKSVDQFRTDQELVYYYHNVDRSVTAWGDTYPSEIHQFHQSNYYWTSNLYTSYEFSLKERHNFSILGGMQFEYGRNRSINVHKFDMLVPSVPSLQTATGEATIFENLAHSATEGYFGRFSYNFDQRYLLEVNARYDGTSVFRYGKRWGFFPSFSAGWNLHKEAFWQPLEKYVNRMKIRGSWGQLGNQNVASYQDIELVRLETGTLNWLYNYGEALPIGYTSTPGLISPNLTWETATTMNLGLDMTFMKNRLQTDFDWFERETSGMIGPSVAQPGVLGANVPRENNSNLRTRGWELNLIWKDQINKDLSYFLNFNLYDSKTIVTEFLNPTGILSNWYEGKEQGEIWGFTAHDLYRSQEEVDEYVSAIDLSYFSSQTWQTGDLKYEDINGDGKVDNGTNTLDDHGDLSLIGNSNAHYIYGISAGVNYKGFDFSMLWRGVAKRDMFVDGKYNMYWGFRDDKRSSIFSNHMDYYRDVPGEYYQGYKEGDANINTDAFWPRPYLDNQNLKNRKPSTRYLQDGSYVRLQNVQIGYTLNGKLLSKLKIQKFRVYLSGENLITITNIPKPIDPIAGSSTFGVGKTYGADRIYSLGLTITY